MASELTTNTHGRRKTACIAREEKLTMRPKKPERCASSAANSAAMSGPLDVLVVGLVSFRRTKYWLSVGVHVSAKNSDVSRDTVMVTASARKKVPVTPVVEMSGRNTTMGVIVEPIRGTVSSLSALRI